MLPKPHFSEEDVQQHVLGYLHRYYEGKSSNRNIYSTMEAFTSSRTYRADGLIAFHQGRQKIITVSLEVKKDLSKGDLNEATDYSRARRIAVVISIIIGLIGSSLLFLQWKPLRLEPLWYIFHIVTTLTLSWLLFQFLKARKVFFTQRIKALQQLSNYPANERWLAFAYDRRVHSQNKLRRIAKACRQEGVGLVILRTDKQWSVERWVVPVYKSLDGKHILRKYLNTAAILEAIQSKRHRPVIWFRLTAAQKVYYAKWLSIPFLSLLLIMVLVATRPSSHRLMTARATTTVPKKEKVPPPKEVPTQVDNVPERPTPAYTLPEPDTTCQLPTTGYLITEGHYTEGREAAARAEQLERLRLPACKPLWLPCTGEPQRAWSVQIGPVIASRTEAQRQLHFHRESLNRAGAYQQSPRLISLE